MMMKKNSALISARVSSLILWLCAVFALLLLPVPAMAQTSIAVVNVQQLLSESKAAKSIQEQVQQHREKFLEELSKQEQTLRDMEKELVEDSKTMNPEDLAAKRQKFEEQFAETRQLVQKRKTELDIAVAKAMGELRDRLFQVVQNIASDKGYDLVISNQNVVVGTKSIDISEESMEALNEAVSKITLEMQE